MEATIVGFREEFGQGMAAVHHGIDRFNNATTKLTLDVNNSEKPRMHNEQWILASILVFLFTAIGTIYIQAWKDKTRVSVQL